MTTWRVLRCNPFNPGGFDPVPPPKGEIPDPQEIAEQEEAYRERFGLDEIEEDGEETKSQ